MPTVRLCRHCHKNKRQPGKRGLCWICYVDPDIRSLYPPRLSGVFDHEPTERELDELIAEQRKCLPAWWDECDRKQARAEAGAGPVRLYRLVKCNG